MKCPKCSFEVGDQDARCPKCGSELFIDTVLADKIFTNGVKPSDISFEDESEPVPAKKKKQRTKTRSSAKQKKSSFDLGRMKLPIIIILTLIVLVIVVLLVLSLRATKGEKVAKKAADYIGADYETVRDKLGAKTKEESAFKGLTAVIEYDYIAESEKEIRLDGVNYPEWAVIFMLDSQKRIQTVKYCDFKNIKNDLKGEKKEHAVNLDKFNRGAKQADVEKELDMNYYSITYTKSGTTYTYRYWYENDAGDEQPVVLYVNYDKDGDYVDHSSELIKHQFM